MKNKFISKLVLFGCCFLLFNNCSRETQETPNSLRPYNLSDLVFNISSSSGSYGFAFYSTADWHVVVSAQLENDDPLQAPSVTPQSGNGSSWLQTVYFTVPQNDSGSNRLFYLNIVSGEKSLTVVIHQLSGRGTINVDTDGFVFPSLGGSATVKVSSNIDWHTMAEDGWYSVSPFSGKGNQDTYVTLSVPQNSTAYRTSSVLFVADSAGTRVVLSQHAFSITPPDETNLPREGDQTIEFQFLSTLPWDVTCDKPWCIPGKVSGAASDAILENKLYIQENSGGTRTAVVSLVNSANEKLSFPITQAGNMAFLHGTQWSGTATLSVGIITKTGSMTMTIEDETNITVRGYPGQITYLDDRTVKFRVTIGSITYEGITGKNITAVFQGTFSADYSRITGTLTGQGTVLGMTLDVSGTWLVSR